MKRIILLVTVAVALFSCQTKKSVLTNEYIQGSAFAGTLPCSDCDGINQVVILDTNNRFRLSESYAGESTCVEKCGNWSLQDGKVMLYSDNNTIAQYAVAGNRLIYLDEAALTSQKKSPAAQGMLAKKNYIRSSKIDPDFLEGIDIVAFGAEPSWSLDIHHKKAIQFSIPGLAAPVAFSPVTPVLQGDSIIYNIVSRNEQMQVVLFPGFCSDGVGNDLYDYKVEVRFRGKTFNGCGAVMNADGTLTGTWLLQGIEGETPSWEKQPYIVVDLEEQQFYGFTGCNNFNGTVRMRGESICFSDINFTSEKECTAINEMSLIDALIKCNGYTIKEGHLQMSKDGGRVLHFRRYLEEQP